MVMQNVKSLEITSSLANRRLPFPSAPRASRCCKPAAAGVSSAVNSSNRAPPRLSLPS